jgi:hypothetical protein
MLVGLAIHQKFSAKQQSNVGYLPKDYDGLDSGTGHVDDATV